MSPLLEDQLRAAFQTHAGDVSPSVDLAEDARVRAAQLRRTKRVQLAAGVVVVAGIVAVVPWLSALGPLNDSAPPAQPTPSASPVAETVLKQARDTRSLMWTTTTIVDGSGGEVVVVPVALEPFGDGFIDGLLSVSRASGGYVVLSGASNFQSTGAPLSSVSYVRPDGTVTTLGKVDVLGGRFAVSPDGTLVAFSAAGTAGRGEALVVTDLAGRVVHKFDIGDRATVLSVTDERVWFWRAANPDDAGRPSAWDLSTGDITRLALTGARQWGVQALAGDMVLVSDSSTPYLAAFDVSDPAAPRELWRDEGRVAQSVAFDGQGVWVLVTDGNGGAQMLSSRTGEVLGSVTVPADGYPVWTANNQWVLSTFPDDTLDLELVSVVPRIAGPLTFTAARYPPADIPEFGPPSYAVPGIELPPASAGR